ncbi:MAG: FAD-dependent oxidoreductase [Pseudomonadota bacterium]|uniref:NAD(P)/FAD-dependent oxidoreductase n=1 Tax=Alcanivorax sp. TaxID=1872427 RepID=UPI0025BC4A02|nr:FAD-dependent oxidoreductase [Alcanivorax sp.]MED5238043.1 FAD-dependent oxidoreductase [Pseudomonadota bacterium]MEE3321008.1 FAD-dependent oxidoreductase [Pseudomonadota bacterium]
MINDGKQRIAIVGAGISGLTAAWYLAQDNDVEVFEAGDYLGGHTCTVPVERDHGRYAIDMGFIVFNDRTYPNYLKLLDELGLAGQPTSMGFAVSDQRNGLEYCGDGLGGVFASKRNWVSPTHWRFVREILRFNKEATALLEDPAGDMPLGEYLTRHGYSERFRRDYVLAMGGAIWSCSLAQMEAFPARFFIRFFDHHGLLSLTNRPQWYVVPGGSNQYVSPLVDRCPATFHVATPVQSVTRHPDHVTVVANGETRTFDQVIFACHSDQVLPLLSDADGRERHCLARLGYQDNEVVLHTDTRLLPRRQRVWSSWNAMLMKEETDRIQVTYNMNILQGIQAPETFCVTLNATDRIDPDTVLERRHFAHPMFTPDTEAARETLLAANGNNRTWFAGAWCRNGFHEDGVVSALNVVTALEKKRAVA